MKSTVIFLVKWYSEIEEETKVLMITYVETKAFVLLCCSYNIGWICLFSKSVLIQVSLSLQLVLMEIEE